MECKIKDFKVNELPPKGQPNSRYYVQNGDFVEEYVTDKEGNFKKVATLLPLTVGANSTLEEVNTLVFSNSNGITFGISDGTITASVNAVGGGNSFILSNANGLSFGTLGSTVTAAYSVPTDYVSSNQSSLFQQTSLMSNYLDTNYTTHTHSQSVQTQGINAISAGTSSQSAGTVVFSNSNNVSFGLNASTITASFSQSIQTQGTFDSNVLSNYQLTSDNSLSLGTDYTTHTHSQYINTSQSSLFQATSDNSLSLGTIYTTHTHPEYVNTSVSSLFLTSQSNQAISGSNGSFTFQTVSFGNLNGLSFYTSNSSLVGSYTVPVQTEYVFSNSNNVSFGTNGSTVTATASFNQSVQTQNMVSVQGSTGNISFSNANGITFGFNNSTITASHNALTSQSNQAWSGSNASSTFQTLSFGNANGISWSNNAGSVQITHALQFTSNTSNITSNALNTSVSRVINLIAATNNTGGGTASLSSNISFSNANNVSFYTSAGNAIVASFSQSVDTGKAGTGFTSAGNNIGLSGTLNTNGLSLSATVAAQSIQTQNLVSINGSTGNISLNVGSSLSSSTNGSSITFGLASNITTALQSAGAYLTTARASNDAIGLNTAQSNVTWSVNSSGLSLDARGYAGTNTTFNGANISGSMTLNSNGLNLSLSANVGGGGDGVNILAAGTQTANTTGTVAFSNSNGITFGMSNSSVITASHNGITQQSTQPVAISGSNGSFVFSTVSFGNSNGLSFYSTNGSIVGSYTVPSQTVQPVALSGSNGSFLFSTATFGNLNGMSFYTSNGSMVGSYTVPTQSVQTQNMVSILGSTGNISFANSNGITIGGNASTITLSHNGLTSQNNQAVSANNGSYSFQTLSFSNANGISFGTSAGSAITASHNGITSQSNQNISLYALGNTTQNSSTVLNASNLSFNGGGNITVGFSNGSIQISQTGGGGVTPVASASNGSFSFTTLAFSNANNVTFGTSAGSIITASVAAPGAAAENNWFNLIGTNTSGNTTASGSTIGLSGINLTLSGTNGSNINISAPATSSLSGTGGISISVNGNTISIGVENFTRNVYNIGANIPMVAGQVGQGTLNINPEVFPNITFDRVYMPIFNSNATNSSGSHTLSFWLGIYTSNGSSISLLTSNSVSYILTHSGTAGSYSLYSGIRHVSIPMSTSLSEGRYFIGVVSRTTSGGANGTYSQMLISNLNSNFVGQFGQAHNTTMQFQPGLGVYSVTTSGIPNSIGFSQIRGSDSLAFRPPILIFANSTI